VRLVPNWSPADVLRGSRRSACRCTKGLERGPSTHMPSVPESLPSVTTLAAAFREARRHRRVSIAALAPPAVVNPRLISEFFQCSRERNGRPLGSVAATFPSSRVISAERRQARVRGHSLCRGAKYPFP